MGLVNGARVPDVGICEERAKGRRLLPRATFEEGRGQLFCEAGELALWLLPLRSNGHAIARRYGKSLGNVGFYRDSISPSVPFCGHYCLLSKTVCLITEVRTGAKADFASSVDQRATIP